jgi:hypothetical protein
MVKVKRVKKGTPHPRGHGVFCFAYNGREADAYFAQSFPNAYNAKTREEFYTQVPDRKSIPLTHDAWVLLWEDEPAEENEFGRVMP